MAPSMDEMQRYALSAMLHPNRVPTANAVKTAPAPQTAVKTAPAPLIRSETFANTPITVFADQRQALSVARDLAEMKTAQGDVYPFYVMDMGRLEGVLETWHDFMPRVQPFYSLRCNSDPVLVNLMAQQPHVGFYCTDRAQLNMAVEKAGPERVFYANPLWTRGNVRHASETGVELLMFETAQDMMRMHDLHPNASLVLRVCLNAPISEESMSIGCEPTQEAPHLLSMAADLGVKVVGISFSLGAGVCSVGLYSHAIAQARRLFDTAAQLGHDMTVLDIGGGFPCGTPPRGPSFKQVAAAVSNSLECYFSEAELGDVRVIAEPGRYFAASLFSLITNITDKRAVDVDIVTNQALGNEELHDCFVYQTNEGFYGSFGCRMTEHCDPQCRPLMEHLQDESIEGYSYATIVGPTTLSDDVDVVQQLARLPKMQVGEWLLWDEMGAYSMENRETLGDDNSAPTVYYFISDHSWEQMSSSRHSPRTWNEEEDSSSHKCEGTESDSHSLGSADSVTGVIEDEQQHPFWMHTWLQH